MTRVITLVLFSNPGKWSVMCFRVEMEIEVCAREADGRGRRANERRRRRHSSDKIKV